jgi:hypothetical protein
VTKLIPYKKAKSQALKLLKANDVKEAENVLALCTDETRLRIYGEMTPHELGLLASRGDLSWIICELSREMLINALAHDPELIDEKGHLYPVQAVAVAYSLTDREDAPTLYEEEYLIRNIVSMAFLVEVPEEFDFEEEEEVANWLLNHWLNRFEPDVDDLLQYDEETLGGITADIREKAREEIRMIQKAMKARATKVEREMFDI